MVQQSGVEPDDKRRKEAHTYALLQLHRGGDLQIYSRQNVSTHILSYSLNAGRSADHCDLGVGELRNQMPTSVIEFLNRADKSIIQEDTIDPSCKLSTTTNAKLTTNTDANKATLKAHNIKAIAVIRHGITPYSPKSTA